MNPRRPWLPRPLGLARAALAALALAGVCTATSAASSRWEGP